MHALLVLVLVSACGRIGFAGREATDDATVDMLDAVPPDALCTGPFGAPRRIDEVTTTSNEWGGTLSDDGLELYFGSNRLGDYNIFIATRTSRTEPFGPPGLIGTIATGADEDNAFLTADGLTLWFDSGADILTAVRASRSSLWQVPRVVDELSTSSRDLAPSLTADELSIYFTSDRASGLGDLDLWVATRATTSEPFGAPSNLGALNTSGFDCCPQLVDQERGLMFTTNAFGNGDTIAYVMRDPSTGALSAPATPANLATGETLDVFETRDGTMRGFANRPIVGTGDFDLYLSERSCP